MIRQHLGQAATALAVCAVLCGSLAGCTATAPRPQPSASSTPADPMPSGLPSALTEFDSTRSAEDNFALFTSVANQTLSAVPGPTTSNFADALIASGADPIAIQFGTDETTEGRPSDAIFWSLQIGEKCLIGEYHPLEQDPEKPKIFTSMLPPVSTGCLLGTPQTLQ